MRSRSTATLSLVLLLACGCRDKAAAGAHDAGDQGNTVGQDAAVSTAADAAVPVDSGAAACLPGHFRQGGICFQDTARCTSDGECTPPYQHGCDTTRGRCRAWDTCGCFSSADCPVQSACINNQAVCGVCSSIPPSCSTDAGCASSLVCVHGTCAQPCTQDCGCRTDKMTFTRDTACQNDGSVEFCLPLGATELLAWVHALAPTVQCATGGGRAGCNPATQLLCSFPTRQAECLAPHGRLADEPWGELCQVASLPAVLAIVPTWFE